MNNVLRVGDNDLMGSIAVSGSPNVFVNNKAIVRNGDTWTKPTIAIKANTVFANGIPVMVSSSGSPNVYAN
jgi:uncharacterized Zn-binding protein involved in type VI secretion